MKNAFRYATQVWLTAAVFAPVIFSTWNNGTIEMPDSGVLPSLLLVMLVGTIFSIPSWLILAFVAKGVIGFTISEGSKKLILTTVASLLTLLPFLLLGDFEVIVPLCISYWLVITLGIWLYRLNNIPTQPSPHPLDQIP